MKRVIDLLCVLVLLTFAFPALAQEESSLSEIAFRKTYSDNWYVSLGANANVLLAEQDRAKSVSDRLKLGGGFSIGKWFNQNTGMSLNLVGGNLRGFNYFDAPYEYGYYTADKGSSHNYIHPMGGRVVDPETGEWNPKYTRVQAIGKDGFWQEFSYFAPTVDLMGNVSNLLRGHAIENSPFDLVAFAGLGFNFVKDNGVTTPNFWWGAVRLGLRANINFSKNLGLYVEMAGYVTDPEFDGYKGTTVADGYTHLGVGLQYAFNKRVPPFEKVTIDELDRLNRRVNENRSLIENHQDILERQQKLLDKLASKEVEKPVVVQSKGNSRVMPEYVRFTLDSYTIEKSEYSKINGVVEFLKDNPDAKILLVGYADRKTGNPTYNYNLSKKRVDTVRDEIRRLGISENRLAIEWKGDREQPFAANDWNRVVIMIERR